MRNEVKFTLPYFFHFFKLTQRERERPWETNKLIRRNKNVISCLRKVTSTPKTSILHYLKTNIHAIY